MRGLLGSEMQLRELGRSGLKVSPLCFGGNVFGWTADEATSFKLLDAMLDSGVNFVDTADSYSTWVAGHRGGESEAVIGNWLKAGGRRERVIVATKVGSDLGGGKKGLAKAYILREVEDSLQRLQTDYIDLYQTHRPDLGTPEEETLSAYEQLVKQGKVRAIGTSNYSAAQLQHALGISREHHWPRYECLQPNYNLYDRADYERELEAVCVQEKIGVIPYFSLAAGFLTGKYRSEADLAQRARGQFVKKYLNERGFAILAALDEVAKEKNATPAQIALAWLIARPSITAPIVSATSVEQWNEIVKALEVKLDGSAIERLNAASRE
jgi:aryl-alcohol dehydrogenase-like predicted oxidoreductase